MHCQESREISAAITVVEQKGRDVDETRTGGVESLRSVIRDLEIEEESGGGSSNRGGDGGRRKEVHGRVEARGDVVEDRTWSARVHESNLIGKDAGGCAGIRWIRKRLIVRIVR